MTASKSSAQSLTVLTVIDCLAVGRGMVSHSRHSTSATAGLEKCQRDCGVEPGKKLRVIQDVQTRWNSSFDMLERLLVLKNALILYDADSFTCFSAHQWSIVQKSIFTLKPFKKMTVEASSEAATIGMIIPSVISLIKFLKRGQEQFGDDVRSVDTMREFMLANLKRRFVDVENSKQFFLAIQITSHAVYQRWARSALKNGCWVKL
jgi:hypothetical protein